MLQGSEVVKHYLSLLSLGGDQRRKRSSFRDDPCFWNPQFMGPV